MTNLAGLLLAVLVYFDGVAQPCVVDTGTQYTVVTERAAARMGTLGPVVHRLDLRGAGGGAVAGALRYIPNIGTRLLGWSGALVAVVPDDAIAGFDCVLGIDLLGQQPIVIDWANGAVRPW